MSQRRRVCSEPGCASIYIGTKPRCTNCSRSYEQQRGTPKQRGYDSQHAKLREEWKPLVEAGAVRCCRCGKPIARAGDLQNAQEWLRCCLTNPSSPIIYRNRQLLASACRYPIPSWADVAGS